MAQPTRASLEPLRRRAPGREPRRLRGCTMATPSPLSLWERERVREEDLAHRFEGVPMLQLSCALLFSLVASAAVPQPPGAQVQRAGPAREVVAAQLANGMGNYAEALSRLRSSLARMSALAPSRRRARWRGRRGWRWTVGISRRRSARSRRRRCARRRPETTRHGARLHFCRGLLHERSQTRGLGGDPGFLRARSEYQAALALAERGRGCSGVRSRAFVSASRRSARGTTQRRTAST